MLQNVFFWICFLSFLVNGNDAVVLALLPRRRICHYFIVNLRWLRFFSLVVPLESLLLRNDLILLIQMITEIICRPPQREQDDQTKSTEFYYLPTVLCLFIYGDSKVVSRLRWLVPSRGCTSILHSGSSKHWLLPARLLLRQLEFQSSRP